MNVHSATHDGNSPTTNCAELGFADFTWGNIFCQCGIYAGWFPIAGMRVGDVRAVLGRVLEIDPETQAVINHRVLSEDDIIGDGVECLRFVKKSSIM